jgi:hypothetical protein
VLIRGVFFVDQSSSPSAAQWYQFVVEILITGGTLYISESSIPEHLEQPSLAIGTLF